MIITHYDSDGKTCLVLAKKFIKNIGRYSICDYNNVDETVNNYLDTIDKYDNEDLKLLITDITVSKETAKRIDEMKHKFEFLMLIDHHPNNNYYLKDYDWCKLYDSDTSATKGLYNFLIETSLVLDDEYDSLVLAVDEWDTWKWEETSNPDAKLINDLAYNLKTHDFLNRFLINPSLTLSKKEKLILGIREEDIHSMIDKVSPIIKGNTCYIIADRYVAEISVHIFDNYKNIDILIVINPVNQSISYRSRSDKFDVSEIARRNGGNGHTKASGSPMKTSMTEKLISLILEDGFQDYTKVGYVKNV
jgi:oligoribonuclease NrnB/cAMP/cGMP phosphodiesterase (DHH superfamily)